MYRTVIFHHQNLVTNRVNYHIGRIVLGSMCVGVSVWLGWSGKHVPMNIKFETHVAVFLARISFVWAISNQ